MVRKSLILGLYAALLIQLTLNLFWGEQGLRALTELRRQRSFLEGNMEILSLENRDVQIRLARLKNDHESISYLARKMGYVQEGEELVYSELTSSSERKNYGLPVIRTGTISASPVRTRFFRWLSFLGGAFIAALGVIQEWGKKGIGNVHNQR
ncbi:MAG: septum formation initiator family protein [Spirochaetales bacterium]|nr:septum formation initiator family protein [Spirochaetales bacterium]